MRRTTPTTNTFPGIYSNIEFSKRKRRGFKKKKKVIYKPEKKEGRRRQAMLRFKRWLK